MRILQIKQRRIEREQGFKAARHNENVECWAKGWAEYFRQDETRNEKEIQSLCERFRALARSVEQVTIN